MEELNKGYEFTKAQIAEREVLYSRFRDSLSYDPETGFLTRIKGKFPGRVQQSKDEKGYIIVFVAGKSYRAHRLIWMMYYNEEPPVQIDHINGITSDNRIVNLRAATPAQNTSSRHRSPVKKSGLPKGVRLEGKRYRASIYVNNKQIYGKNLFDTPEEAAADYDKLAIEHHGEFAKLNNINSPVVSPLSSTSETDVEKLKAENQSLKTELEAARSSRAKDALDAERYRWMRSFRPGLWLDGITLEPIENEGYALQLDSTIDAAIEQDSSCNESHEKGGVKMSRLCRLKSYKNIGDDGKWAYSEITQLRQQLAESQATEAKLREALRTIADLRNLGRITPEVVSFEALALPHDDTALKEYRDAVIDDCIATTNQVLDGLEGADNVADALRVMKGGA